MKHYPFDNTVLGVNLEGIFQPSIEEGPHVGTSYFTPHLTPVVAK